MVAEGAVSDDGLRAAYTDLLAERDALQMLHTQRGHVCDELLAMLKRVVALPCYVARPGEATYECRVENLCAACNLRGEAEALVRRVEGG